MPAPPTRLWWYLHDPAPSKQHRSAARDHRLTHAPSLVGVTTGNAPLSVRRAADARPGRSTHPTDPAWQRAAATGPAVVDLPVPKPHADGHTVPAAERPASGVPLSQPPPTVLNTVGADAVGSCRRRGPRSSRPGGDPVIITVGFTESDRDAGYVSFRDGYRPGARQEQVTLVLDGDGSQHSAQDWAEAVFVASNHPGQAPAGPARGVQLALAEQVHRRLRSLSVGDTVTVHGQTWACENTGWRRVDQQPPGDIR